MSAAISNFNRNRIEAVLFDCDGVLVDTEYLKFVAWQKALAAKNIPFAIEEYMPCIGHSSKNILCMVEKHKNLAIPVEVIALKNAIYCNLQKQGIEPIAEMIAFAKRLLDTKETLGIKVGLASSAATAEILQNLEQIGLQNRFDLLISGSSDLRSYTDPEGTNKPKPYVYLEAAKRLYVSPANCIVFEDTAAGIQAAVDAGMLAIAVPNRFTKTQDFSQAHQVIHSYKDLPAAGIFKK